MKIKNLSSYEFKQFNVVGVKAQINFAKTDNLEINLHEELSNPITEQNINLVEEFEPLLFAVDMETTELVNSKELNIDCLTLLDGHHSCLLYTSPSPRDRTRARMPSSA